MTRGMEFIVCLQYSFQSSVRECVRKTSIYLCCSYSGSFPSHCINDSCTAGKGRRVTTFFLSFLFDLSSCLFFFSPHWHQLTKSVTSLGGNKSQKAEAALKIIHLTAFPSNPPTALTVKRFKRTEETRGLLFLLL